MTSWRVYHLDMLNLSNVLVQYSNQISLHTLHVVDIVPVLEIRAVHLSKKLYCSVSVCEEVARCIKVVESFDHLCWLDGALQCEGDERYINGGRIEFATGQPTGWYDGG